MNFLNRALSIIKFVTVGACILAGAGIDAMQQEKATWHTVPFELQLTIWGGAENNNFCAKIRLLNKFRLVCKSWNSSLRNNSNLKAFFDQLFLKSFTESQCKAVINFLSFVLSDQNINPAEKTFLTRLYNHFRIGTHTLAQLVNDDLPLHVMVQKGADKAALCLLTLGANKDAKDDSGCTPLHRAAWYVHLEIAKLLLIQGANKEIQDGLGRTPLHLATSKGHLEIVMLLLAQGSNKEIQDNFGYTPLHFTVDAGYLEIARLLLAQGANKETQDFFGRTPLHSAARNSHIETVKLLLAQCANKDAQDNDGRTSLHFAVRNGHIEIVKLLLLHNVNTASRTNNEGLYPNMTAADIAHKQFSETNKEVYKQIFNLLKSS